eukprot:TRINITY_DN436_c0_g1_i1.p1 TRINITY_DN436_c0_g1~~TRINITY_DN436_c0_g1_i1.p1  ORF type:complete len:387 (-),score=87.38 TRINITY_DN436_c0_g1_i1:80-1240(-)
MASRPLVQVYDASGKSVGQLRQPTVLLSPIRNDVVQFVQSNVRKNKRQAYAVNRHAGEQTSAESWGTGRAVARIPRVPGGGTHRAGQGAFGNMCRGGRMYAPTRIWRRWHRKVNLNQKRYAVASALAASAVPALVMARGHRINQIHEVPLVVANEAVDTLTKTKDAVKLLKSLKAYADVERVANTEKKNNGRSKWRNRAKSRRVGPLIIHGSRGAQSFRAFRNLPGVEITGVWDLNILRLAPGGHVGRFIIWTKSAFEQLDTIFGTSKKGSSLKKDYFLPRPIVSNPDLGRIIKADSVASVVRGAKPLPKKRATKTNFLNRPARMALLNPYAQVMRRVKVRSEFFKSQAKKKLASQPKVARKVTLGKKLKASKKRNAAYNKLVFSA